MTLKKKSPAIILLVLFILLPLGNLSAAPSISFGYFHNKSKESTLNYLERIIPNSLASTLKNKFQLDTVKPRALSKKLGKNQLILKKNYDDIELPKLSENLNTDFFIFGDFEYLENNRIKITVNIYEVESYKLFTFTDYGRLETEIFKLVDRISDQLKNITGNDKLYLAERISPNSNIGVITNLSGDNLNKVYYEFLKKKFRIKNFQSNSLKNIVSDYTINNFFHISSSYASYRIIADKKDVSLLYTTWSTKESVDRLIKLRSIYQKYAFNFIKTQNRIIDKIQKNPYSKIDYLIIIGFDDDHETAWSRCINIKNRRLVFTQSNIESDTIGMITQKIIQKLSGNFKRNI